MLRALPGSDFAVQSIENGWLCNPHKQGLWRTLCAGMPVNTGLRGPNKNQGEPQDTCGSGRTPAGIAAVVNLSGIRVGVMQIKHVVLRSYTHLNYVFYALCMAGVMQGGG